MLKEKMQISTEEIAAIGDNMNDEEMIKNAGLGIAMGQSHPHIKEIANQIVAPNTEDGVAEALNLL